MRTLKQTLTAAVMLLAATPLLAESSSAFLSVSMTVLPNCQIAVTDLAFGAYDPLLANAKASLDATADLRMLCTRNAHANVVFDYGRNSRGALRGMAAGSERVGYELYQDSSRTKPWGSGENALHVIGVGGREPQRFVVYGRVSGGQEVPPGAYSDVVLATVDF
ncbi:MAG: spore coat U domain-containing protein [Thermoanaerobaculia bacterium]